ncbi:MAG TPA: MFS transporter [Candidatus Dormibacteraeota bacterium]|nr:MFS transporter [Candidatus Dormibacteraeota bacterium]
MFWLVAINLRTVLLSVPPTLPALHRALHLSYSVGGLLTSVPVLVMAAGAIPGAYLVSRRGARGVVTAGLVLLTVGTALRGAVPNPLFLFTFTVVLAIGIAISQPAMPALVQAWFPDHVARATAVYSNGLLIGEVLAATLTLPFLLALFGWQVALSAWAILCAVGLALWLLFTPATRPGKAPSGWFPDWRNATTLRLSMLMGAASLVYFGMNTWIPDTMEVRHAHNMIPLTLGVLNFSQLPVSAGLALAGDRMLGRRWPYLLAGGACLLGVLGYLAAPVSSAPIWAALAGAGSSLAFIVNLGVPALLSPTEVARTTGLMFTVGYGSAFFGPALGGVAWDLSGRFVLALVPMAVAALLMLAIGGTFPRLRLSAKASSAASRSTR